MKTLFTRYFQNKHFNNVIKIFFNQMCKKHFGNVVDVVGVVLVPLIYALIIICFRSLHPFFDVLYASFFFFFFFFFIINECSWLYFTQSMFISAFISVIMNWYKILRNDTIEYIFCFPTLHFQFIIYFTCFTATQPCEKKG